MPLAEILDELKACVAQCENLVAAAHKTDAVGAPIFATIDRQQITVAAFLNMFVAWERFLEFSLAELMAGGPTIGGVMPTKYVSPVSVDAARKMVVGILKFFDFGNQEYVRKLVNLYFENGYPYEPHLSAIVSDLADLRAMRNAAAHTTSATQTALEALGLRIFGKPVVGIDLYSLLTAPDPRSTSGETVLVTYRAKLIAAAELISQG